MFREQGADMNSGYGNLAEPQRPMYQAQQQAQVQAQQQQARPEMRGPQSTDIDNILSGLKTRTVNIHEQPTRESLNVETVTEDDSMISISSLKGIDGSSMPKRSNRRKNSSAKNTISLDI
jgi:hypothetical protein